MSNPTALLRRCREELAEHYGCRCELSCGDERFDLIWAGTLKSLFDRTDHTGFCATSYGEENNVRAYGLTHYPRDTAEAGRILAEVGAAHFTDRILAFSLDHIPEGQYYVPHVYHRDGSIRANTIQVDTPAHLANALAAAVAVSGATPERERLFRRLATVMEATWNRHFHPECGLLDGGNYNEQGYDGSADTLMDIFTNAAFEAGCRSMGELAEAFDADGAARYAGRARILEQAIESRLATAPKQGYWAGQSWPSGADLPELNWLPLYAHRWHAGDAARWDLMWERLAAETAIDWDGFRVTTGETPGNRYKLLGKFYAAQLAYCAECGRQNELEELIHFAARTVKRPDNLFPEWWFHHRPADLSGYFQGFLDHYRGIWSSYCDDPDGDYTVDSGNCEQSAAFLHHVWHDVAGIEIRPGQIRLAPALTTPMQLTGGPDGLAWSWDGRRLHFHSNHAVVWRIRLPVRPQTGIAPDISGAVVMESVRTQGWEIDFLEFRLASCQEGEINL